MTAWAGCDFLVTQLLLKTQARVLRTSSVTKIKCWRGKQKIWTGLNQTKHFPGLEQGLQGKKRTETMINYFNVSNSTSFKSKIIFFSRNSYFLWLMVKMVCEYKGIWQILLINNSSYIRNSWGAMGDQGTFCDAWNVWRNQTFLCLKFTS